MDATPLAGLASLRALLKGGTVAFERSDEIRSQSIRVKLYSASALELLYTEP